MSRSSRRVIAVIFSVQLFSFAIFSFARAETMSSANFKVQNDVLNVGGGGSASASFIANDSIGDVATGEDLSSTNFKGCAGYECFQVTPYIAFSVKEGTSAPGVLGADVSLGTLSRVSVTTSDGVAINSVFVAAQTNAKNGINVTVADANTGLLSASASHTIPSADATLVGGTEGYGLCVFSVTQSGQSPTVIAKQAPYNGVCTKTVGHVVGGVSPTPQTILASTGQLKDGLAEVLTKAAISVVSPAASDYTDTLTFIGTGTF